MRDLHEQKRALRAEVRAARLARSATQRTAARDALTSQLCALVESQRARSLTCFLPTPSEPDPRGFLAWAQQRGLRVLLPASRADGRLDWISPDGTGTVRGAHGIDEPRGEVLAPGAIDQVDLMLIPAAAVDARGNRLGWGRGYFDRCLAELPSRPPVYAVLFDEELRASLPRESHDVPITGVVTPKRTVRFAEDR